MSDTIQFDFGEAWAHLQQSKQVRRLVWRPSWHWVKLYHGFPYFRMNVGGGMAEWTATQKDLVATDWVLVEEEAPKPRLSDEKLDTVIDIVRRA